MSFAHPQLLWSLLVLLPALGLFYWWSERRRRELMCRFIEARLLPGLLHGYHPARRRRRFACFVVAVTLLLVALARPRWGFSWETLRQRGLDIVVAIDTSKSMMAADIAPNRLARAKLAALELMQRARTDRFALVAFAGAAFLQCPLTVDEVAFRQCVEALDVNIIPQGGTALAPAIRTALSAFKEGDSIKVLVLLSDGEDHEPGAVEAAKAAAEQGLKIFTIGLGTPEGDLLRVQDAKGRTDYVRDSQGNVVKSRLNESLLQQIAEVTGGFYLPLRGARTIDTLYEQGLAPLPRTEGQQKLLKRYHERYHLPLAAAILLLILEMLLPESAPPRRRTGPTRSAVAQPDRTTAARAGATALTAAMLLWGASASASPRTGLREYQLGRFDRALQEFERALRKRPDDPRLHFNAGAAAYRDGRFDVAAEHFARASTAPDLKLQEDAYYNLGNALYRRGEAAAELQQRQQNWETALRQYEHALRLNTNNADARFNHEFVRRRLEELKQHPPPPQSGATNQPSPQQQQAGPSSPRDQPDASPPNASQTETAQPNPDTGQPSSSQSPSRGEDQNANPSGQPENASPSASPATPAQQQAATSPDARSAELQAMTPEEARRLLDAQKQEEKILTFAPEGRAAPERRVFKDW